MEVWASGWRSNLQMTRHGFLLQSLRHRGMRRNQMKFHSMRRFVTSVMMMMLLLMMMETS